MMATKARQGTIIVEPEGDGWLMMTPDGNVAWRPTREAVERLAQKWFADHLNGADVGIGYIEWRDG